MNSINAKGKRKTALPTTKPDQPQGIYLSHVFSFGSVCSDKSISVFTHHKCRLIFKGNFTTTEFSTLMHCS